jgi:hypothetical protein
VFNRSEYRGASTFGLGLNQYCARINVYGLQLLGNDKPKIIVCDDNGGEKFSPFYINKPQHRLLKQGMVTNQF